MKAIFWKEIRENLKWCGVGFAVFSFILIYGWTSTLNSSATMKYYLLLAGTFSTATMLCAAVLAAALGFLQIVPEQRRDRWAFLVHRPVPWTTIFWGKTAAGLTLYFTAMLVPWLVLWRHAAYAQVGVPFDWRMGLEGLAQILAGSMFYFGGMICALRQARWLGSKGMVLAGTLWIYNEAVTSVDFEGVCAWTLAMGIVLAIAARGNFLKNGTMASQPAIVKVCMVAVMLFGMVSLTAGICEFVAIIQQPEQGDMDIKSYHISKEGEPIIVYEGSQKSLNKIEDIDGNDLHLNRAELGRYLTELPRHADIQIERVGDRGASYNSYYRYFAQGDEVGGMTWFYARSERRLVGYDYRSPVPTAYFTPDGYHPASEGIPASQFSGEFLPPAMYYINNPILDGKRLYYIDYVGWKIHVLAELADASDLLGIAYAAPSRTVADAAMKGVLVTQLKNGIYFYKAYGGTPLFHVPMEVEMTQWNQASVTIAGDNEHYVVTYWANTAMQEKAGFKLPVRIFRYTATGVLEKQWTLPTLLQKLPPPEWKDHIWRVGSSFVGELYNAGVVWLKKTRNYPEAAMEWASQYKIGERGWEKTRMDWIVTIAAGLICAGLALWRMRPYALPLWETVGWTVLVFFGGAGGLLTLLAIKEWPARVKCKACGEPRMVDRETCEHCAAGWEKPMLDGTEIFGRS